MRSFELDTLAAAQQYIESETWLKMVTEMRSMQCQNITIQLWDNSPALPEPLKPPSS